MFKILKNVWESLSPALLAVSSVDHCMQNDISLAFGSTWITRPFSEPWEKGSLCPLTMQPLVNSTQHDLPEAGLWMMRSFSLTSARDMVFTGLHLEAFCWTRCIPPDSINLNPLPSRSWDWNQSHLSGLTILFRSFWLQKWAHCYFSELDLTQVMFSSSFFGFFYLETTNVLRCAGEGF